MKNTIRLVIALGFAGFAAFLNAFWVHNSLPKYEKYTVYNNNIEHGDPIHPDDFKEIKLPTKDEKGKNLNLSTFFVPWEKRGDILTGSRASRNISVGAMALQTDASTKDIPPELRTLGPFPLLTVGTQYVAPDGKGTEQSESGQNYTITLVVKKLIDSKTKVESYEPKVRQLLSILARDKNNKNQNETSILAVVAMRGTQEDTVYGKDYQLGKNEEALMINLPNVPALSTVLLNNPSAEIGFVVPASLIPE